MYSNMKYYENISNCLRVIQQDKNMKLKSANCWQQTSLMGGMHNLYYTAAFTYYYDPVILQTKLTTLPIFRDLALRKRNSKALIVFFYVFYWVYTNIPKLYGLVVYYFMDFLGDSVACVRFGTKIQ